MPSTSFTVIVSLIACVCMLLPSNSVAQDATAPSSSALVNPKFRHKLKWLRSCAKQCENRIRQIGILFELDCAIRDRDESLGHWRQAYYKRGKPDYSLQRETQLRGLYFKNRAEVSLLKEKLSEIRR